MVYKVDIDRWGGFFSVPYSVAEKYLKISDGNFIKVLLCVLAGSSQTVDTADIAVKTGLNEETVEEAILYWGGLNVLSVEGSAVHKEYANVSVQDVRNVQSVQDVRSVLSDSIPDELPQTAIAKQTKSERSAVSYHPSEIAEIVESKKEIGEMFLLCEQALGKTINHTYQVTFLEMYEYLQFPVQSIMLVVKFCADMNKTTPKYINKVANDWHDRGITSPADVEKEIIRQTEYYSYENKAKRVLELSAKTTTPKQQKFFEKWASLDVSEELLQYAKEISIDSTEHNSISLPYIDKIVTKWAENGIKTRQQAEEFSQNRSGNSSAKGKVKADNNTSQPKSFTVEDLENRLKNHKRKI